MKIVVTGLLIFAGAVLQATLFNYLDLGGVRPSLLLITTVFFGLHDGPVSGALVGFICGLLEDSLSSGIMGVNALARTLLGFTMGSVRGRLFRDTLWYRTAVLFLASLLGETMVFTIRYVLEIEIRDSSFSNLRNVIFLSALYNTLLAPLLFFSFDKLLRKDWISQKRM